MKYTKQSMLRVLLISTFMLIGSGGVMATEEAKYQVNYQQENFQVRQYEAHIVAETIVDSEFEDAGSEAFQRLFKYISGNNTAKQSIDMTAPVSQEADGQKIDMTSPVGQQSVNGRWAVSFMMPASSSYETLPKPNDSEVVLKQVPERYIASIEYSGFWSETSYKENKNKLQAWISKNGYQVIGEPIWARYNDPFTLWFLRRNEILIPIENPSISQ
ncbi:SOUL family heme-binding protein [Psychromonas sp. L1A2]|uniref:SOUL family heme-binding protein n=1 Tax=Psychromonas sp. L1A2 TaxID=2686356 RepID=UPI001F2403C7|nr:heme-binding protein [Psychromonas sp. L1A2]